MKDFLIIEDELLILRSLERLLKKSNHSVDTTTKGFEAINLIKKNDYDCIVCDLMLKDTTGFDVIEDVISFKGRNYIQNRFIIMTAYISEKVLEKAHSYGCEVLSKPFKDLNSALEIMKKGIKNEKELQE